MEPKKLALKVMTMSTCVPKSKTRLGKSPFHQKLIILKCGRQVKWGGLQGNPGWQGLSGHQGAS